MLHFEIIGIGGDCCAAAATTDANHDLSVIGGKMGLCSDWVVSHIGFDNVPLSRTGPHVWVRGVIMRSVGQSHSSTIAPAHVPRSRPIGELKASFGVEFGSFMTLLPICRIAVSMECAACLCRRRRPYR